MGKIKHQYHEQLCQQLEESEGAADPAATLPIVDFGSERDSDSGKHRIPWTQEQVEEFRVKIRHKEGVGKMTVLVHRDLKPSFIQYIRFKRRPHAMQTLARWSDWAPTPASRKWLKKLIADQAQHELELRKADRVWAARWIVTATFFLGVSYVLRAPLKALVSVVRKSSGA